MSENFAPGWLDAHPQSIPVLDHSHDAARYALNSKTSTLGDLTKIIQLDPGMSLALYSLVNSKLERAGRQRVSNIHSALGLLGQNAISSFVNRQQKLSDIFPAKEIQQAYHQLVSRSYHMLNQATAYLDIQGIKPTDEIRSAALLHFIGEMFVCLFEFERYQDYYRQLASRARDPVSARSIFKFEFNELGLLIAEKNTLPLLAADSLSNSPQIGRQARSIQLAGKICFDTEFGWDTASLQSSMDITADFLGLAITEFRRKVQDISIHAARTSPVNDVFHAAAGLIILPSKHNPAPKLTSPAAKKPVSRKPPFEVLMRILMKTSNADPSQLMSLLINHIHEDLGFSQVLIMLLSADKSSLTTRLSKGIPDDSAMLDLKLPRSQNGLVNSLLSKPQALLINKANLNKYQQLIPNQLKAVTQSGEYILMSLFIADKPEGLIYCDCANSNKVIDRESYASFKACVLMTSESTASMSIKTTAQKAGTG